MNKFPNVKIVAVNIQGLKSDLRKRTETFLLYSKSSADIILMSETGRPTSNEVNLWTLECKNLGLYSLFLPGNNTAILWKANSKVVILDELFPTNQLLPFLSNPSRTTDATFCIGDTSVTIVSVYIPVMSTERRAFLTNLSNALQNAPVSPSLIIGGDWNCVEDPFLDSSKVDGTGENIGVVELKSLLHCHTLSDAFRITNRKLKVFTNTPTMVDGAQRRLDRFYLSQDLVGMIRGVSTLARKRSTHNPIQLSLYVPGSIDIGPGKFKFGLHHLEQEGIPEYLTEKVSLIHSDSLLSHPSNPILAWNLTKIGLAAVLNSFSRVLTDFNRRHDTNSREQQAFKSAAIRARLHPGMCGLASVHIRLKQIREADLISSILTTDGEVTSTDAMLGAAKDFFSSLYSPKACDPSSLSLLLAGIERKLSPSDAAELEEDYTSEELATALKSCQRRSSPGPDGIPFEFYSATWKATGPILLAAINFIPTQVSTDLPLKEAHIHLPHKKGDHSDLSNKRPISIMNTDERLFSQAHNKRLAPLLHTIINPSQTGFIPGRWIGHNIAEMQCAMDTHESHEGLIASMDFEKAYDRISHEYMKAIFEGMGFGPKVLNWFASTYLQQTARVFLNGWLSDAFSIASGVRQGDPLAPSLFAIIIEGFACLIRKMTAGIKLHKDYLLPLKESLFADDAVCFLRDYSDFHQLQKAITIYCLASGSKLNDHKSFLYPLGKYRLPPLLRTSYSSWTVSTEPFRHLGVRVGIDVDVLAFWNTLKSKVIHRIRTIPMFDLPLATRCNIINIYCYSKILYVDRFSPAPKAVIKEIINAAHDAIWGNKSPTVKRDRLYTPLDRGGFGLINLDLQLLGHRAEWIFKLLSSSSWNVRYLRAIRCIPIKYTISYPTVRIDDPMRSQSTKRYWTWYSIFCHPSSIHFDDGNWLRVERDIILLLPDRWKIFLESWNQFSSLTPSLYRSRQAWNETILSLTLPTLPTSKSLRANSTIPHKWFSAPGTDLEDGIQLTSFVHTTANLTLEQYPIILPDKYTLNYGFTKLQWKRYWECLRKIRAQLPDEEGTAHLLSLGSLHPGKHTASLNNAESFPNNTSKYCVLCLTEEEESLQHLLVDCQFSQQLYSIASFGLSAHPTFTSLLCPIVSKSRMGNIAFNIIFIHIIWKLSRSRRYSTIHPLTLIEDTSTMNMARKLGLDWKFSGLNRVFSG